MHCVKSVQIRSFLWSVFSRIQSKCGKIRTRKNFRIWALFTQWWLFCKFSVVFVFSNCSIAYNEKSETPETSNSLRNLIFLFQVLKDSRPIYVRRKILTVWTSIRSKQLNTFQLFCHITFSWNCYLLKNLWPCSTFSDCKGAGSILGGEQHPNNFFATPIKFSNYSVIVIFSKWLYSSERKPGNVRNF